MLEGPLGGEQEGPDVMEKQGDQSDQSAVRGEDERRGQRSG